MTHHLEHVILVLVGERLQEELLQVLFQRQIDETIDRILARLLRDFRTERYGGIGLSITYRYLKLQPRGSAPTAS